MRPTAPTKVNELSKSTISPTAPTSSVRKVTAATLKQAIQGPMLSGNISFADNSPVGTSITLEGAFLIIKSNKPEHKGREVLVPISNVRCLTVSVNG